ncbi:hypothetical protein TIFTF001_016766 [Ficus carica]|uniref:Uncharacterized protein n=1 Tax=Ficus carica TaxID=3494 RepID=A0AA88A840_FICCA|nr:hypothetical protein TIFTF001_016766 [Ficus carica]
MNNQRHQELLPLDPEIERTFLTRRMEQQGLAGEGEIAERVAVNMANDGQQVNVNNLLPQPVLVDDRDGAIPETQATESSSSLENLIEEYIAKNDAGVQSHDATLRSLENQIGQIANTLNEWKGAGAKGKTKSCTERAHFNPRTRRATSTRRKAGYKSAAEI